MATRKQGSAGKAADMALWYMLFGIRKWGGRQSAEQAYERLRRDARFAGLSDEALRRAVEVAVSNIELTNTFHANTGNRYRGKPYGHSDGAGTT